MLANYSDEKYFAGITSERPDKIKDKAKDEKIAEYVALLEAKEMERKLFNERMEQTIREHAEEMYSLKNDSNDDSVKTNPRGAGRKEKMTATVNRLSDMEEMLNEIPAAEVAEQLGISRATLFKRLKKARDERDRTGEDPFIL